MAKVRWKINSYVSAWQKQRQKNVIHVWLALMIVICDCFVMAVNCSWAKGKIILANGVRDSWYKIQLFPLFCCIWLWLSSFIQAFCLHVAVVAVAAVFYVCVYFIIVVLLLLFLSYRWSAIWVVRVHDFSDQTMKRGETAGVSGIITASVYRWNYALAPEVEKPTASFRVSILACSKRIHWNIILFVKCFT